MTEIFFKEQENGYDKTQVDNYISEIKESYHTARNDYLIICEKYNELLHNYKKLENKTNFTNFKEIFEQNPETEIYNINDKKNKKIKNKSKKRNILNFISIILFILLSFVVLAVIITVFVSEENIIGKTILSLPNAGEIILNIKNNIYIVFAISGIFVTASLILRRFFNQTKLKLKTETERKELLEYI